jgi:hypothetical protein
VDGFVGILVVDMLWTGMGHDILSVCVLRKSSSWSWVFVVLFKEQSGKHRAFMKHELRVFQRLPFGKQSLG